MIKVNINKNLPDFNLNVHFQQDNGILGFLGSSGSGKSMSLKSIAGLVTPTEGEIILNDSTFFSSSNKVNLTPQKRNVGFLFQNYALFPNMTVLQNIKIGLTKQSKAVQNKLSLEYVERLGLTGLENHYPWQLSGGQQQRVSLARALITNPNILLLDEPFSALDYHLRLNMEKELLSILANYKGNVIFVTHDIEEAFRVCDNIIVFEKGTSLENRNKKDLFNNPKNLTEATLTGCKNISKAKKINDYTIYAEDWGLECKLSSLVKDNINYVGLRAHFIKLSHNRDLTNSFPFIVDNIIENPFDYTVYIRNINKCNSPLINFFIDKRNMTFSKNEIIHVQFPEDYLFTF